MIRTGTFLAVALAGALAACTGMNDGTLGQVMRPQTVPGEAEIAAGLKEALGKGVSSAITTLGRTNGFWGNTAVRVPLPPAVAKAENAMRKLGLGERVDEFHLTLNRAAERAVPEAASLFGDAVRQMTLADARAILQGSDDAATQYFRRTTGTALEARLRPIVVTATQSVGVTQKYKSMVSSYGPMLQLAGVDAGDLDSWVTAKTVDGVFHAIAEEEARIRRDPAARTTELLRRVFGAR